MGENYTRFGPMNNRFLCPHNRTWRTSINQVRSGLLLGRVCIRAVFFKDNHEFLLRLLPREINWRYALHKTDEKFTWIAIVIRSNRRYQHWNFLVPNTLLANRFSLHRFKRKRSRDHLKIVPGNCVNDINTCDQMLQHCF